VRRIWLVVAGLIGVVALAGCAARLEPGTAGGAAPGGSVRACAAYAYRAIERQQAVTGRPAACAGLSRAEVNQAASTAIRQASGSGPKSAWRKQAGAAAPWVNALLTGQVPVSPVPAAGGHAAGPVPGSGLGGVSEPALKLSALLAWLATAASGGFILVRWLLAGGRPRRRSPTAAPPSMTLGHAGFGLLGLVIWVVFMVTGAAALAWIAVAIMAPVAGLGMGVLALGLPSPRPADPPAAPGPATPGPGAATRGGAAATAPAATATAAATATLLAPAVTARPASRSRIPVLAIAAHGLFAVTALLLVLLAAVGAG
jgi:hypothetical protein